MTWLKRICLDTIQQLRMYMQTVKNIDIVFLKQFESILPYISLPNISEVPTPYDTTKFR